MSQITCQYCGERHDIWDECGATQKSSRITKRQAQAGKDTGTTRQRPLAVKLFWKDGRTSAVIGTGVHAGPQIDKVQPLYGAKGCDLVSYHEATEQLAYSMHGTTLNQLDDKEAERIRHLARVTVDAAIGITSRTN